MLSVTSSDPRFAAPSRYINVTAAPRTFVVHLGPTGSDFFAIGPALLPFHLSENILAVYFESGAIDPDDAERIGSKIAINVDIEIVDRPNTDQSTVSDKIRTLLFDIGKQSPENRDKIIKQVRDNLDRPARFATAINFGEGSFRAIDNRFVIHFSKDRYHEAASWLSELKAVKLRSFQKDSRLWLVEFSDSNHAKHIAQLMCLAENGVLDVAEPDLIYEVIDHDVPSSWPDDPRYLNRQAGAFLPGGGNHGIQRIRGAWNKLTDASADPYPSLGNASVHVALFDSRLRGNFQDMQCSAADGTPQIADCFDTNTGGECTPPPPVSSHGAAVSGVAGACTNNHKQVAGIAPGVHYLFIERPADTSTVHYADALIWMAGFPCNAADPPPSSCDWRPIKHSPDIINASHGMSTPPGWSSGTPLAMPTWTRCAFNKLVTSGRSGRGTVLVYSAGNQNSDIEGRQPYAASRSTLAVSNCKIEGNKARFYRAEELPTDAERDAIASNFGDGIDLCAIGYKVPTLRESCVGDCSAWCGSDFCYQTGTSFSAPTVSGAAALMLSANPDLSWYEIGNILRKTANWAACDQSDPEGHFDLSTRHSRWYGFGLLDAHASVVEAFSLATSPPETNPAMLDPICE